MLYARTVGLEATSPASALTFYAETATKRDIKAGLVLYPATTARLSAATVTKVRNDAPNLSLPYYADDILEGHTKVRCKEPIVEDGANDGYGGTDNAVATFDPIPAASGGEDWEQGNAAAASGGDDWENNKATATAGTGEWGAAPTAVTAGGASDW